jgi:2',3'-cyclic-nucleotide 2'-phosphodiesterase (5'-nucleotidase family)
LVAGYNLIMKGICTILHTNDMHLAHYARLATLIIREGKPEKVSGRVLVYDAGDYSM